MATKESEENNLEAITKGIDDLGAGIKTLEKKLSDEYTDLKTRFGDVKGDSDETKAAAKEAVQKYTETAATIQGFREELADLKRMQDAPIHGTEKDLDDHDLRMALKIQKALHEYSNKPISEYEEDRDNLVDMKAYRRMVRKMMAVGRESKQKIVASLDQDERKAFEASTLGPAFFTPEALALVVDCNIECEAMTDLYGSYTVDKSKFTFMRIKDYGDLGAYTCDAVCDAEFGEPGNITHAADQTYDFRGVFCFQRKVLDEANFDFLSFMINAAQRSHRINRNRALISGDGKNEPLGWLKANCFPKKSTGGLSFNHQDFRRFVLGFPAERGQARVVMHQNAFAWLATQLDSNQRFIFADGDILFSPASVTNLIRLSNCLPDFTTDADGNPKGTAENPFEAGDFIAAQANWKTAYYAVNKRPLFFEQYEGGSSAWCVKYQFGAEDGGFVGCCEDGQILEMGPPVAA